MAYTPLPPESYQGNQVLINSDRLIFNAKKDSILLYSDKVIGFSTNGSFHFDTSPESDSKFVLNSPNIYLGLEYLPGSPTGPNPLNSGQLQGRYRELRTIISDLDDILSENTKLV